MTAEDTFGLLEQSDGVPPKGEWLLLGAIILRGEADANQGAPEVAPAWPAPEQKAPAEAGAWVHARVSRVVPIADREYSKPDRLYSCGSHGDFEQKVVNFKNESDKNLPHAIQKIAFKGS